jgi:hypothetical protein
MLVSWADAVNFACWATNRLPLRLSGAVKIAVSPIVTVWADDVTPEKAKAHRIQRASSFLISSRKSTTGGSFERHCLRTNASAVVRDGHGLLRTAATTAALRLATHRVTFWEGRDPSAYGLPLCNSQ